MVKQNAKYQVIASELKEKIRGKKYEINETIPSEKQLQEYYQVSRHTVREAISLLVNEGYLRREKGSGTYVSEEYTLIDEKKNERTVGVITTYISNYIFPSIIRGIEKELNKENISVLISSTNNDIDLERKALEMMINKEVDGLIIEPTSSNRYNPNLNYYLKLNELGIPFVMINAYYEELSSSKLIADDIEAGYIATNYLLDNGHKDILLIAKHDDIQGKNRLKGFIKAYQERKLSFDNNKIITYTTKSKEKVMKQLEKYDFDSITGIVCYNDEIAIEVLDILKSKKYSVPQDISIVSHDDSFLSTTGEVALTSVSHPKEKLGEDAASTIINALENPDKEIEDTIYAPTLIKRDSVKEIKN